jgi:hypothetical protein
MKFKIIIICTALLATVAHADFRDGNKLLAEMKGTTFEKGMALGYVMAVADTRGSETLCIPSTVTAGQVIDMTQNMLEKNPSIRHLPASAIVEYTLREVWPCAKKGGAL